MLKEIVIGREIETLLGIFIFKRGKNKLSKYAVREYAFFSDIFQNFFESVALFLLPAAFFSIFWERAALFSPTCSVFQNFLGKLLLVFLSQYDLQDF